jgi:hypothetical protein
MVTLGTGAARLDFNFQIGSYRLINFEFNTDISLWEFEFFVKKNKGDRLKVFSKTLADGISFPIYSDTSIDLEIETTDSQIEEGQYYCELRRTDTNTPLISGYGYFDFDPKPSSEETVSLTITEENVNVTISNLSVPQLSTFSDTSTATLTPNINNYDAFELTAQAEALTIANPTGSIGNFDLFTIRIKSTGSYAISFGNLFRGINGTLQSTITSGNPIYITCMWNSTENFYDTVIF